MDACFVAKVRNSYKEVFGSVLGANDYIVPMQKALNISAAYEYFFQKRPGGLGKLEAVYRKYEELYGKDTFNHSISEDTSEDVIIDRKQRQQKYIEMLKDEQQKLKTLRQHIKETGSN